MLIRIIFFVFIFNFEVVAQQTNYNEIVAQDIPNRPLHSIGEFYEKNIKVSSFFLNKSFDEVFEFYEKLPIKSKNYIIQDLVKTILVSKLDLLKLEMTDEQEIKLFELRINKLFSLGEFSEIEKIYLSLPPTFSNQVINIRRVEAYFLRNQYKEGCELLNDVNLDKSYDVGKFEIICSIVNQNFDKARFHLSLLKEQAKPGDNFFIDLAYNIMGDIELVGEDEITKNLERISSLTPILLSSLQIAEISPTFENIKSSSISNLIFILASPTSSIEVKLYTAEILIKLKRIEPKILAEVYQLELFENKEIENVFTIYKTLSPVLARSLLYQSIIKEKNPELKFDLIKILLNQSKIEKLYSNIAFLIKDSVEFAKLDNLTKSDYLFISDIYISQSDYESAEQILNQYLNASGLADDSVEIKLEWIKIARNVNATTYIEKSNPTNILDKFSNTEEKSELLENYAIISSIIYANDYAFFKKLNSFDNFSKIRNKKIGFLDFLGFLEALQTSSNMVSLEILFMILNEEHISELLNIEIFCVFNILYNDQFLVQFQSLLNEMIIYSLSYE